MGLVLHCKLKYRVWPNAHISRLRLKIFFTPKYLPKRPHGTKFRQNPRNGGSQRLHEIENLSVKSFDETFLESAHIGALKSLAKLNSIQNCSYFKNKYLFKQLLIYIPNRQLMMW